MENLKTCDLRLLEITKRQAISLYNEGITVYIVTNDLSPDSAFNAFTMRKGVKDASLNYYIAGRTDVPLEEYVSFIERNQAEPIYFYTLNSTELYMLPYA